MIPKVGPKVIVNKLSISQLGADVSRKTRQAAHLLDGTSKNSSRLPQHTDKRVEISRGWKTEHRIDPCGLGGSTYSELVPGDKVQIEVSKKGFLNMLFGKHITKDTKSNTKQDIFDTAKQALDELGDFYKQKAVKKRAKNIKLKS